MKSTQVLVLAPVIVVMTIAPAVAADIMYPASDLMSPPAVEDRFDVAHNEIVAIGNATTDDSYYASLSFRHSFTDPDEGLKVRFDAAYSTYNFGLIVPTEGDEWRGRALVGYAHRAGSASVVTIYAGAEYHSRDYTPDLIASPDISQWGVFGAIELSTDLTNGGNVFAGAEYSTNQDSFYASFHYIHPVFGGFLLGPTANYVVDEDYERWAAGLRAEVAVSDHSTLTITGAYGQDSVNDEPFEDMGYIEAAHSITF